MPRLDSFVARALLDRLRQADEKTGSACTTFWGTALFVDMSHYTELAEALCGQGGAGEEQLGTTLDLACRAHARAVNSTGGEIACFAGDAFLAYWPAADHDVSGSARAAEQCARLLHAASQPDSMTPIPPLHIGLGAGTLWAARLGSDGRRQVVLGGHAVREACAASTRAGPGETVRSVATEDSAGDVTESIEPTSVVQGTPHDAELAAYVPRRVHEYVGDGLAAWIPQWRTICALFVRIDGLDERDPEALPRHEAVVASLEVALRPYTGSNGALLVDDKGLVFTLCLGMPHDAHADDALRAVRAGLAIRSELARQGLTCAVGVASGPGVCMPLGGPERRHYWSVGRFMHVAARLMGAAGSGMLCTEDVADRVRRVVTLSPERPLVLKGLSRPLRVFRALGSVSFDDHSDLLFGREDEQTLLDQRLDAFESGRGAVVWMVGEAGLGKSALLRYLSQAASRRGITSLLGGAGSVEIAVAYAAWKPVYATLLSDGADTTVSQAERLRRVGHLRHPQLASLVNAVVPGLLEDTPLAQAVVGQARVDATLSILSEILTTHATPRFVLALEDCHWMDSASWRLLLRVVQDHPQSLIVLTSRPTAGTQEHAALRQLDSFIELTLSPLRATAMSRLVENVLDEHAASHDLADEIMQYSAGNPLFAREYALLLTTRSLPRDTGPRARPSRTSHDEGTPVTLQNLIASRLDALSPIEDLVLKTASVIGDRFTTGLLARAHPGGSDGESLGTILMSLLEKQLIVRTDTVAEGCAFQHAVIREVTYAQLTREQREVLHRGVAEAYEREFEHDLPPHYAELAHHWSRANAPGPTMLFGERAAAQALAAGAFEEADRLLRGCIEQAKSGQPVPPVDRMRWYRQVADARHGMGQLESRIAAAHQVLRIAGERRPHTTAGLAIRAIARLCRLGLRQVVPRRVTTDAPRRLEIARAYRHSAEVCYFSNALVGMVCDSVSAVEAAASLQATGVLAGAVIELGGILSVAGFRRIGEPILHRAIAMAEEADDQSAQAYAHMVSCLYHVGVGNWQSAERSAQRCQALCEPMDDRVNWTNAQVVLFWMHHYRGHGMAAYDAACRLRDRATETGNRQHRGWAFRCLALCALGRDEPREAGTLLLAARECLGETAALNERVLTLGLLALAQLREGNVWSARATAREGLSSISQVRQPIGHSTLEAYSALFVVALDGWHEERSPQWKRAIALCMRVLRRYRRSFPVGEARYQLHRGDYWRLSGRLRASGRAYRRGEAAAVRVGMPAEAARCRRARDTLSGS